MMDVKASVVPRVAGAAGVAVGVVEVDAVGGTEAVVGAMVGAVVGLGAAGGKRSVLPARHSSWLIDTPKHVHCCSLNCLCTCSNHPTNTKCCVFEIKVFCPSGFFSTTTRERERSKPHARGYMKRMEVAAYLRSVGAR